MASMKDYVKEGGPLSEGLKLYAMDGEVAVTYDPATDMFKNVFRVCEGDLCAPAGFLFDGASVPRPAWVIIPKYALGFKGPLFHDLLYRKGGHAESGRVWTRKEADQLFYTHMRESGVSWWKAKTAYLAVRAFGRGSWRSR